MFACMFAPDFSVQAVLRLEPEDTREVLKQSPIAILDGPASLPRVMATNEPARLAGIEMEMTKLQVETCGRVWLRKRSPVNETAAQTALLDCATGFSPRVESTAPGTVILDLAGTEKLFGRAQAIAQKIVSKIVMEHFARTNNNTEPNQDPKVVSLQEFDGKFRLPL